MKQIICDICGNVINDDYYLTINLPTMHGGRVVQRFDIDCMNDVCQSCSLELYDLIEKFKNSKKERS